MGSILVFKKFIFFFLLYGFIPPLAQITQAMVLGWASVAIIMLMMALTILPELAIIFSKRLWNKVLEGMEDGDGIMNTQDLKEFIGYYGIFLVLRCFVGGFLYAMTGGWNPSPEVLYSPLAFVASSGLVTIFSKKKK